MVQKRWQSKENVLPFENEHHPTAVIHPQAELGDNVEIGPYAVIEKDVKIEDGCRIHPHVVIKRWTTLDEGCVIYPGAVLGAEPQDVKFKGEKSYLKIGANTTIRESATLHRATGEGEETRVGCNVMLMAYSHIAHNCHVGNSVVLTNAANIGGHVVIEDRAIISGLVGVHQFVRIGKMVMVGGHSKVVKDIPPFLLADGHPAHVNGVNVVGLRRNKFSPHLRNQIKKAYRILYRSELNVSQAINKMEQELEANDEIEHLLRFLRNADRGICR